MVTDPGKWINKQNNAKKRKEITSQWRSENYCGSQSHSEGVANNYPAEARGPVGQMWLKSGEEGPFGEE